MRALKPPTSQAPKGERREEKTKCNALCLGVSGIRKKRFKAMKRKIRSYWVDEDERVHRFPWAQYERICHGTATVRLFMGKTIRFIEAIVEVKERGEEELLTPYYIKRDFDSDGKLCKDQKMKELKGTAEMLSVFGQPEWEEFCQLEYQEPFRWKPTKELEDQLREVVRTKKKHS